MVGPRRLDTRTKLKESRTFTYDINGRKYTFVADYVDGGIPYGRCQKLRKWGRLYDSYIQFEGGEIVLAKRIS